MTWGDGTSTGRTAGQVERGLTPSGGSDTTQIQAAIDAVAAAGGGVVLLGPGTFLASGLVIKGDVTVRGFGVGATILKLADGANVDLVKSESFDSLTGGTTRGGPENWAFEGLTLDGNKANNTSGWPLRVFGAAYRIDNFEVQNGASGGVWSEWGTGGTDMEAFWSNFRIHDCNGWGLDWRGPHDSPFTTGKVFKNGNGIRTLGNATSEPFTSVHTWGTEHAIGWWFKAPAYCVGCHAEGATDANVILDCNNGSWLGGQVYGTDTGVEVGFEFGREATARYWDIRTRMHKFSTTGTPLAFVSNAGNQIDVLYDPFPSVPAAIYTGTPSTYEDINIRCPANPTLGATWTRRVSTGGEFQTYSATGVRGLQIKVVGNESYIQLRESTTHNNASSDSLRLSANDNGGGKTLWLVRFASGAAQTVATEP